MSTDTTTPPRVRASRRALRAADGRLLGKTAKATRKQLLDSLLEQLQSEAWHKVSAAEVARGIGRSPATFYQYFPGGITDALAALCLELVDEQRPFPPQLQRIVHLRNGELGRRARKLPDPIADRHDALAARIVELENQLASALDRNSTRRERARAQTRPSSARELARDQLAA